MDKVQMEFYDGFRKIMLEAGGKMEEINKILKEGLLKCGEDIDTVLQQIEDGTKIFTERDF